jgi:hypothetical protein
MSMISCSALGRSGKQSNWQQASNESVPVNFAQSAGHDHSDSFSSIALSNI